jgi:hypothetical protein
LPPGTTPRFFFVLSRSNLRARTSLIASGCLLFLSAMTRLIASGIGAILYLTDRSEGIHRFFVGRMQIPDSSIWLEIGP